MSMRGRSVAVLGGDRRMSEAVKVLRKAGVEVRTTALPYDGDTKGPKGFDTSFEVLADADLALLPVQGVDADGHVFVQPGVEPVRVDREALSAMNPYGSVWSGIANSFLREVCQKADRSLVEYREADEFAIWNSIPSAEGALQMAMEDSPYTLFGSRALVLGFGRTGKALALLLRGLNADVSVAVRREVDYANVWSSGYRYVPWSDLGDAVADANFIFNTAPAPVLNREHLVRAQEHAVVIDVASAPGGTDFEAAGQLGVKARLAPGLPGIVAPATAGKILADLILRRLAVHEGKEDER